MSAMSASEEDQEIRKKKNIRKQERKQWTANYSSL